MTEKKVPMRTCIACRTEKPKKELVRLVRTSDGSVSLDRTGKISGRGAYCCDDINCINKIVKAKLLNKAFEMEVPLETYEKVKEDFFGSAK